MELGPELLLLLGSENPKLTGDPLPLGLKTLVSLRFAIKGLFRLRAGLVAVSWEVELFWYGLGGGGL